MGVGLGSSTPGCALWVFSELQCHLLQMVGVVTQLWESLPVCVCVYLVATECLGGPSQPARTEWQVAETQGLQAPYSSLKGRNKAEWKAGRSSPGPCPSNSCLAFCVCVILKPR